jgi:hypothetical protein
VSDKRADETYQDAEATLHEVQQIQDHLMAQDDAIGTLLDKIAKLEAARGHARAAGAEWIVGAGCESLPPSNRSRIGGARLPVATIVARRLRGCPARDRYASRSRPDPRRHGRLFP